PPPPITHAITRCNPMPSASSSTSASAIDLSSTERNGGESNCSKALRAASSIVGLLANVAISLFQIRDGRGRLILNGTEMLDLSDPKIWKDGANVVLNNLHVVAPLVFATAMAAWWFRGKIENATISGLRERIGALEERRQLAEDNAKTLAQRVD